MAVPFQNQCIRPVPIRIRGYLEEPEGKKLINIRAAEVFPALTAGLGTRNLEIQHIKDLRWAATRESHCGLEKWRPIIQRQQGIVTNRLH
jgi:hypothetical protein